MIPNFVGVLTVSMAYMNLGCSFMNLRLHVCGVIWRESRKNQ